MINYIKKPSQVVNHGFCIGCGACTYKNTNSIHYNEIGMPEVAIIDEDNPAICPFTANIDENKIGEENFSAIENIKHDEEIGFYLNNYAGYVKKEPFRKNGSSGGFTSWISAKLLQEKLIDGIIHVGKKNNSEKLFEFKISSSLKEINENSKSKYYAVSYEKILENLDLSKKYAFIGIPCHIKSLRLLCKENPELNNSIIFFIGIFCGHLKTSQFSELLSWQQGIEPSKLKTIDFRVKNSSGHAGNYQIEVESKETIIKSKTPTSELYGTDWGLGLFKPKACDWCDDIAGEGADIVLGDAWLPEFDKDPQGTNIIVVRKPIFDYILKKYNNEIQLIEINKEKITSSQSANFRHRREGLLVRTDYFKRKNLPFPLKRSFKKTNKSSIRKKFVYILRYKISQKSHLEFMSAKKNGRLIYFLKSMLSLEILYYALNGNFIRWILSYPKKVLKILKI